MAGIFREALALNGVETFSRLWDLVRWKLNWDKCDLKAPPEPGLNHRFVSAMEAIELIPNNAVVASSGFAGSGICNALFWAIKASFLDNNCPRDLTLLNVGAQGGRGKVPGTVEELAEIGLLARYVAGHLETPKSLLRLGQLHQLELHTLPQGIISRLFALQADKVFEITTQTGLGTFLDPAIGEGSAVTPDTPNRYIRVAGDSLCYQLPPVEVALLSVPCADQEGNLYFHNDALISENDDVVRAAKANAGIVIAVVGELIARDDASISICADQIDAIVIHPYRPQMAGVTKENPWSALLPGSKTPPAATLALIRLINKLAGITSARSAIDNKLAELAVSWFIKLVRPASIVNFGVGMPEEVCRLLFASGYANEFVFTTESGAYGGIPAPGIFFGTAVNPQRIESSSWMFNLYQSSLDVAVLGFLQVDSVGNVNVSKRGDSVEDFVGPGGFCDITEGAKIILFVGSWMVGGQMILEGEKLKISKAGRSKFVQKVDHITFNAQRAIFQKKLVYYITDVGVFKLTANGLKISQVVPGVDVQRDIVDGCDATILFPSAESSHELTPD